MVGKHIDVGRPVTYQSASLVASDKAVVMARVIGARASDTTTSARAQIGPGLAWCDARSSSRASTWARRTTRKKSVAKEV
jgi:hypothetical protein